ncbi:hypothetical protein BBK82_08115 [Lentzea guizhouensis]|uniref:Anti-sigma factor antagonist n=2 Tax=Lentzea guizhouensis TaxID=1586287 RepID=A0A1B2HXU9_9PSEU|nr:hypothetical protein BBK82_08115 [Lentzea guizhouensis]
MSTRGAQVTTGGTVAEVRTTDHDGVLVAVVTGELDPVFVDAVETKLFEHIAARLAGVVAELAVRFLGSAGLSMLLEVYGKAQHDGVGFAIVATGAASLRPLQATGLNHVLPVSPNLDNAIASVRLHP